MSLLLFQLQAFRAFKTSELRERLWVDTLKESLLRKMGRLTKDSPVFCWREEMLRPAECELSGVWGHAGGRERLRGRLATGEEREAGHGLCWVCVEAIKGRQGEAPG